MHIPDGFIDPKISVGLMGAAGLALSYCLFKVKSAITVMVPGEVWAAAGDRVKSLAGRGRRVLNENKIYQMGMLASLIFAAQMFNFPINSGTSGHLIGGVLAAVLLGPFAGTLAIAVVLAVQAFFFADGGFLALGANIVNMAVLGTLAGYYLYAGLRKFLPEWLSIAFSAWCSVILAAAAAALEIGFSGTYALAEVMAAMLRVHVVIGLAEALITLALINLLRKYLPEFQEKP